MIYLTKNRSIREVVAWSSQMVMVIKSRAKLRRTSRPSNWQSIRNQNSKRGSLYGLKYVVMHGGLLE